MLRPSKAHPNLVNWRDQATLKDFAGAGWRYATVNLR